MSNTFPDPEPFPVDLIDRLILEFCITDKIRVDQLREDLEDLPNEVETYRARRFIPNKTEAVKFLRPIVNQCNKVLDKLGADNVSGKIELEPDSISPIIALLLWEFGKDINREAPDEAIENRSAHENLQEHMRALANLRSKTQNVINSLENEKRSSKGGDRRDGDVALDETIKLLLVYYRSATTNDIGFTYDSIESQTFGPLIDFLQPCLKVVGWDLTADAIRSHVRNLLPDNPRLTLQP
jgi:hypothetical protein